MRAFEWFGGVPAEVLVDNQKAAVLAHRRGGDVQFHPRFLDLGGHYGFRPRACRPARAQTKGKDEGNVGYVKHHFFVRYRAFESWAHLNQLAEQWLREEADPRVHGTVREVVAERFAREAPTLGPLPPRRYDTAYWEPRQVAWDAYVEVRGNRYSVPGTLAGQPGRVRITLDGARALYDGEQCVAQHVLPGRGDRPRSSRRALGRHAGRRAAVPGRVRGGDDMELTSLLERMKMEHLLAQLDGVCEHAAKGDLDYKSFLPQALEAEWRGRHQRGVESRLKLARLPWVKSLEQFDFDFQPSIDRKQVRELAGLGFVERAETVVLLGPPGVGKTHVSISQAEAPDGAGSRAEDAEGQDDGRPKAVPTK